MLSLKGRVSQLIQARPRDSLAFMMLVWLRSASVVSSAGKLIRALGHKHMDASDRQRWLRALILTGVLYGVVGITFGAIANRAASNQIRVTWRLAAWVISAAAFAAHIGYEHVRLRSSPRTTALHASLAVALGAFALAVAANVHGQWVASSHQRALAFALVAWPVLAAVPAFVVALVASAVLALRRRST